MPESEELRGRLQSLTDQTSRLEAAQAALGAELRGLRGDESIADLRAAVEDLRAENRQLRAGVSSSLTQYRDLVAVVVGQGWVQIAAREVELALEHALEDQGMPPGTVRSFEEEDGVGLSLDEGLLFDPQAEGLSARGRALFEALGRRLPRARLVAVRIEAGLAGEVFDLLRERAEGMPPELVARLGWLVNGLADEGLAGSLERVNVFRSDAGEGASFRVIWPRAAERHWSSAVEASAPRAHLGFTGYSRLLEDPNYVVPLPKRPYPTSTARAPALPANSPLLESVVLHDAEGKLRIQLELVDERPRLTFFDGSGRKRIELGLDAEERPYLEFLDEAGARVESFP